MRLTQENAGICNTYNWQVEWESKFWSRIKPWGRQGKWWVEWETYFGWTIDLVECQKLMKAYISFEIFPNNWCIESRAPFYPPLALTAPGLLLIYHPAQLVCFVTLFSGNNACLILDFVCKLRFL